MAEINSLTGATAPTPSQGGTAPASGVIVNQDGIDNETRDALAFLDLVRWIQEARHAVKRLGYLLHCSPELSERFRHFGVHVGELDWDTPEEAGLRLLHLGIRDALRRTRTAANVGEVSQ